MDKFKKLHELQNWLLENKARGSDEVFKAKVVEMKALMDELYTVTTFNERK